MGDSTVAVLPVRAWRGGKQRLAPHLSAAQREALIAALLTHVVECLAQLPAVAACAVVSGDPAVRDWAAARRLVALAEALPGLNPAVEQGRRWALDQGAARLLVVLPDLPLLAATELALLLADPAPLVLAPDRAGRGTNALALRLGPLLPFVFGADSLAHFQTAAAQLALPAALCHQPGLAYDLDTAADLAALPASHPLWQTALADLRPTDLQPSVIMK